MRRSLLTRALVGALPLVLLLPATVAAQATRTWVSGVGDDANPCSRTAPCKTFAGAISKTAAGGEINALDPGGYGAVTITKSITITMPEGYGGILNASTTGVIVNAAGIAVRLTGIVIDGAGSGVNGINFLQGASLHVDRCSIRNNAGMGIRMATTSGASDLVVTDSVISNNVGGGIDLTPSGSGQVTAMLTRATMTGNGFGLRANASAGSGVFATVRDSVANANNTFGLQANATGGAFAWLMVDHVVSSNNASGVLSAGTGAIVVVGASTITMNSFVGIQFSGGGQLLTRNDNTIFGNATNGTASAVMAPG
jgi:hypothetical protein